MSYYLELATLSLGATRIKMKIILFSHAVHTGTAAQSDSRQIAANLRSARHDYYTIGVESSGCKEGRAPAASRARSNLKVAAEKRK